MNKLFDGLEAPDVSRLADVTLVAWRDRPNLPGRRSRRRVRGVYDPTLRRIELFECTSATPDAELVRVLLHELAHAAGIINEIAAKQAADRSLGRLQPRDVAAVARKLRSMARSRTDSACDSPLSCSPLSIGL